MRNGSDRKPRSLCYLPNAGHKWCGPCPDENKLRQCSVTKRFAKRFVLFYNIAICASCQTKVALNTERISLDEPVLQTQARCHRRLHTIFLEWSIPRLLLA